MTEARSKAISTAKAIREAVAQLPAGTATTITSGWRSDVIGFTSVNVRVFVFNDGAVDVTYFIDERQRNEQYIDGHVQGAYERLNWTEADCIHLVKSGYCLIDGIKTLATEMTVD